jgi:hypothetical protein
MQNIMDCNIIQPNVRGRDVCRYAGCADTPTAAGKVDCANTLNATGNMSSGSKINLIHPEIRRAAQCDPDNSENYDRMRGRSHSVSRNSANFRIRTKEPLERQKYLEQPVAI